jgi:stearoyl-CoA desaturase (delta-9 desaturase)
MDPSSVKVSPAQFSPITPPLSPQLKARVPAGLKLTKMDELTSRSDMDVPDNYVEHTIRTVKPLPPLSWSNFHTELNWLNVAIICVMPVLGLLAACYTPLCWKTFFFSVFYYFRHRDGHHRWLPSTLGSPVIQRQSPTPIHPCNRRCRRRRGFY